MDLSPVAVTNPSKFSFVLSKELLDFQANIECGFTLKPVVDITRAYSQIHRTSKYPQDSSMIPLVWLNGWVFVYKLGGCRLESSCSHLLFRCRVCLEQRVPWHSGKDAVSIHSETHTWYDKNIQQRTDKYSQHSSIICPVCLNGWVFVYKLSGCGFKSSCSQLNFKFRACFEQGVPWHSEEYRVCIHSKRVRDMTRTYS